MCIYFYMRWNAKVNQALHTYCGGKPTEHNTSVYFIIYLSLLFALYIFIYVYYYNPFGFFPFNWNSFRCQLMLVCHWQLRLRFIFSLFTFHFFEVGGDIFRLRMLIIFIDYFTLYLFSWNNEPLKTFDDEILFIDSILTIIWFNVDQV